MKTLYVSDLDGTLLRSDATTSEYTNQTINNLVEKGMLFSYATARSYVTARKATRGIKAQIPLIVYNGAFVIDNATGEILLSNFFGLDVYSLLDDLIRQDIYPIVYSFLDGAEVFSYLSDRCTKGMREFLDTRKGDPRDNPISDPSDLYRGDIFYVTCIDEKDKLEPMFRKYQAQYHTVFDLDIYSRAQWLEFMPRNASKSNAARQLKALLGCQRMVAFGDGKNDIDLFQLADECCAVSNAAAELKEIATHVIGGNDEDGVANWLLENFAKDAK